MEGNKFKSGDYIKRENISDELTFRAVKRVCGSATSNYTFEDYETGCSITYAGELSVLKESLGCKNQLTLNEWLFKNAPEWAVDLRQTTCGEFYYTDGGSKIMCVRSLQEVPSKFGNSQLIATRTLSGGWYDYKSQKAIQLPPIGCKSASYNAEKNYNFLSEDYIGVEVIGWHEHCAVVKHIHGIDLAHLHELRPNDYNKLEKEARDIWVDNALSKVGSGADSLCEGTMEALYDLLKEGKVAPPEVTT